ncbi:hypothetical protein N9N28_01150 [Rubripirellula amarantea]|nr:hypothetical protein [Rubripirellula amarantea]
MRPSVAQHSIPEKLLAMLQSPTESGDGPFRQADSALIERINHAIAEGNGDIRDGFDQRVQVPIEGGIVSGNQLYPVRNRTLCLVAGDAIQIR